jgi:hypothetical protein
MVWPSFMPCEVSKRIPAIGSGSSAVYASAASIILTGVSILSAQPLGEGDRKAPIFGITFDFEAVWHGL